MSLTAPYSNSMRIGQGFNTYTQETRLENAVKITIPTQKELQSSVAATPSVEAAAYGEDEAALPSPPSTPPQDASSGGREIEPTSPLVGNNDSTPGGVSLESAQRKRPFVPSAASLFEQPSGSAPFEIVSGPVPKAHQSVTYSTRAVENVSDIMDALRISTALSIKYGTIHGNGSTSFVNENKVMDSQLNYVVSVTVSNDAQAETEEMRFMPIEGLPPDKFTTVYGDSFISGFLEGGEFNAVISIQVNDKSKLRAVKQAVDLQLAVGPMPVEVGASEEVSKAHAEILQDTEITISVNWSGGGEIKKPEVPWTLSSVVAVANAFPSMVSRCSARTSAILTRYESLRSFQSWKWGMIAKDKQWGENFEILNYVPCALYTADLFDALMAYKKLWKKIGEMLQNPSRWKMRETPSEDKANETVILNHPWKRQGKSLQYPEGASPLSPCDLKTTGNAPRTKTFDIKDDLIVKEWGLDSVNLNREPIPVDPIALNEARLLCREAMTLITEEASRLVDHPHLAYADYDPVTMKTQMKRPNYGYPEVLRARLPIQIENDAADDSWTQDAAAVMTHAFSRNDDLFCHIIGDPLSARRTYKSFTSLTLNESQHRTGKDVQNQLARLSLHGYHHHLLSPGRFSKDSNRAIGAIGFAFAHDSASAKGKNLDACSIHYGRPTFHDDTNSFKAIDFAKGATPADITRIDISYVPGTGRIAGIALVDKFGQAVTERLAWKQWESAGHEPAGLKVVTQQPPSDGSQWRFVGVCGDFDSTMWGEVLARVSGIWRRF